MDNAWIDAIACFDIMYMYALFPYYVLEINSICCFLSVVVALVWV